MINTGQTRRCDWCGDIAQGICGCPAEIEIDLLRAALAVERERCAKVCKTLASEADGDIGFRDGCHECADGIRGLTDPTQQPPNEWHKLENVMTLTKEQAQNIVDAHCINLDDGEETEILEDNNPELAAAYRALLKIAEGGA